MKKTKKIHWLLSLVLFALGTTSINAQFDDLYFDESELPTAAYQTEDLAYQDFDDATIDEAYTYDEDEYDEYLQYRENDYDVDAYRFTNRFNNLRFSNFYSRSSYLFNPYGTPIGGVFGYSNLNRIGLSFNFGIPSAFSSFSPYGYNPFNRGFNRFGQFNRFNRFGGGFGAGGFGVGRFNSL